MVKKIFGQCYIWLILILMYLPVLVLIAFSFTEATNVGEWTGFSFNLFPRLFQSAEIMTALANTVIIAISSALVATILGSLGAVGAYYSKKRMRNAIDLATQIPVVNAEIVVAFSFANATEGDNLSCSRLKHDPLLAEMKKARMAFPAFSTFAHIIYARGKSGKRKKYFCQNTLGKNGKSREI